MGLESLAPSAEGELVEAHYRGDSVEELLEHWSLMTMASVLRAEK